MVPITDFPFAFCGIATVAATLGYACARRAVLSLASLNEPSKVDVEACPPESRSLKRKLDDSDEHDADAEELPRPMKRNKTPPTDQHNESDEDSSQEWQVIVAPPPYEETQAGVGQPDEPVQDNSTLPKSDLPSIEQDISPVHEPTPPAHLETSHPEQKGSEARRCSTSQPSKVNLFPNEPESPPSPPSTPPTPAVPTKTEPAKAFSAFSCSSSPFASYSNASGASPFVLSGQIVKTTPAWRHNSESESDVFGRTNSTNVLAPSPNNAASSTTTKSLESKSALDVPGEAQPLSKSSSHLTGEEDEDVGAELKGVKLFVKRGRKEFTDGMYGHIKILSQKSMLLNTDDGDAPETETKTNCRTRLLFRRDPLGQVSMNVGLHPTVRCHFDSEESILRVITVEQMTVDGKGSQEDIVVYALKPGRTQKGDFQSFAKTLCDHDGLKSRVVMSSAASASGEAAAS